MNTTCPVTGKRSYKHYQEAMRIVGIARKQGKGCAAVPLSAYRCASCGRWHLTSMTQAQVRAYQRAKAAA